MWAAAALRVKQQCGQVWAASPANHTSCYPHAGCRRYRSLQRAAACVVVCKRIRRVTFALVLPHCGGVVSFPAMALERASARFRRFSRFLFVAGVTLDCRCRVEPAVVCGVSSGARCVWVYLRLALLCNGAPVWGFLLLTVKRCVIVDCVGGVVLRCISVPLWRRHTAASCTIKATRGASACPEQRATGEDEGGPADPCGNRAHRAG